MYRSVKEAKRKEKEKAKSSGFGSFFSKKKAEEVDLEEDHEDYEEVVIQYTKSFRGFFLITFILRINNCFELCILFIVHFISIQVHTLQLTGKRLEAQRREVGQLSYSLNGATIFFKRTDMDT